MKQRAYRNYHLDLLVAILMGHCLFCEHAERVSISTYDFYKRYESEEEDETVFRLM